MIAMQRASTPDELGTALRSARERMGLTQEQLAQKLGVAIRTVARWESGTTAPKPAVLAALGLAGGVAGIASLLGPIGHLAGVGVLSLGNLLSEQEGADLRRERQLAGINAVVKSLAERYGFPPHAFARAAATLIAEMVEAGLGLEDLIVLLTSVDSIRPPAEASVPGTKRLRSQKP